MKMALRTKDFFNKNCQVRDNPDQWLHADPPCQPYSLWWPLPALLPLLIHLASSTPYGDYPCQSSKLWISTLPVIFLIVIHLTSPTSPYQACGSTPCQFYSLWWYPYPVVFFMAMHLTSPISYVAALCQSWWYTIPEGGPPYQSYS
jgi:hypothetical protein